VVLAEKINFAAKNVGFWVEKRRFLEEGCFLGEKWGARFAEIGKNSRFLSGN